MKNRAIKNVVITGEESAIQEIKETVNQKHQRLSVEIVPTIQFKRCELTYDMQATLSNLSSFDYLFFSSSRAVNFFVESLKELHSTTKNIPPAVVVGPMTALSCERAGMEVISQPKTYTAEDMIKEFSKLKGSRILFPRSTIAPEDTITSINNSGAKVVELSLYETVFRAEPLSKVECVVLADAQAIMFLSPSSVRSFIKLVANSTLTTVPSNSTAFCIGPRTERVAKEYGFKTTPSKVHTVNGLIRTLETLI